MKTSQLPAIHGAWPFLSAALLVSPAAIAQWEPLTGADAIREIIGGATVEYAGDNQSRSTARYHEDGTAVIDVYDGTFQRTWEIKGDDQVCYHSSVHSNCYTVELDRAAGKLRATNVVTGAIVIATVVDQETRLLVREGAPTDAGSVGSPSAAEIAAELANPNTVLGTLNFLVDYTSYKGDLDGANDADAYKVSFQPALPYPLTETANLFIRPLIPVVISQDVPTPDGFRSEGIDLGDISFDLSVANSFSNGLILGGGLAGTLPTATEDRLGLDQWLLGPEVFLGIMKDWGVIGLVLSHQVDVAGEDDFDTRITGGQYFYSFNVSNGWVINASPTFTYNHEAASGDELTFPVGIGVAKTTIIGHTPWRFGIQLWSYVEQPDPFGPEFQIRFQISPVVPLPWGN